MLHMGGGGGGGARLLAQHMNNIYVRCRGFVSVLWT